jgi:phosphatidylserine synthase 2
MEVKHYDWSQGLYTIPTITGKVKRMFLQFTPESWMKVEWEHMSVIKQFMAYNLLMFSLHLVDLNAFFLKYILWVPPENKVQPLLYLLKAYLIYHVSPFFLTFG